MNFLELVKERHSVRHYAQQVVEKKSWTTFWIVLVWLLQQLINNRGHLL